MILLWWLGIFGKRYHYLRIRTIGQKFARVCEGMAWVIAEDERRSLAREEAIFISIYVATLRHLFRSVFQFVRSKRKSTKKF